MNHLNDITAWASYLSQIRVYFNENNYLEVQTPHLVPVGAFESSIDCLSVLPHGELHTSPEIEMKKLLSSHPEHSIFQIAHSFRNDPDTPIHFKEFRMLEWYGVGKSYEEIINETLALFSCLLGEETPQIKINSVNELFIEKVGISLNECEQRENFAHFLKAVGIDSLDSDTWSDLFFKAWIEKVEPSFVGSTVHVVKDYPTLVSPLSKSHNHSMFAQRFEIYWHDMEICNGCVELTDPIELERRYNKESSDRQNQGKPPHAFPSVLFESLKKGLPECSGVAVGLERLFMALKRSTRN